MINLPFTKWLKSFQGVNVKTGVPTDMQSRAMDMALFSDILELEKKEKLEYIVKNEKPDDFDNRLSSVKWYPGNILLGLLFKTRVGLYGAIDRLSNGKIPNELPRSEPSGIASRVAKGIVSAVLFIPELIAFGLSKTLSVLKTPYFANTIKTKQKEKIMSMNRSIESLLAANEVNQIAMRNIQLEKAVIMDTQSIAKKNKLIAKLLLKIAKGYMTISPNLAKQASLFAKYEVLKTSIETNFVELYGKLSQMASDSRFALMAKAETEKRSFLLSVDFLADKLKEQSKSLSLLANVNIDDNIHIDPTVVDNNIDNSSINASPEPFSSGGIGNSSNIGSITNIDEINQGSALHHFSIEEERDSTSEFMESKYNSDSEFPGETRETSMTPDVVFPEDVSVDTSNDRATALAIATEDFKRLSGNSEATEEEVVFSQEVEFEHYNSMRRR